MKLRTLLTTVCCPMLVCGCSTLPVFMPTRQANLLVYCPDLTPADARTMGELLAVSIDTATQYRECQSRHNALVDALK